MQIPPELMQFVRRDTYSLLIKGNSGTGKSTLSLTILKALQIRSNFFYISTRLSPKQLFVNYPWLDKFVIRENVEVNDPSNQRSSLSSFEDARLDEPESLFERITNQLMDVKAPIIIIDSWDAIASFMDTEARLNNERVLQTWRERAGAKLIFTSEDSQNNTLDFIVDGIVELKQKTYRNTDIRQVFLTKLRGTKINRSSYMFTLGNGIFKSYNHYNPSDFQLAYMKTNSQAKKDLHDQTRVLSRPNLSLKKELKYTGILCESPNLECSNLVQNITMLIEIDQIISLNAYASFLAKIASQFMSDNDNGIIIQPASSIERQLISEFLHPYLGRKAEKNVKLLYPIEARSGISKPIDEQIALTVLQGSLRKFQEAVSKLRIRKDNNLLGMLMLEEIGDNSYEDFLFSSVLPYLRSSINLSILVTTKPLKRKDIVRHVDVFLKLRLFHSTLLVESVIPSDHWHALSVQGSIGFPIITLDCLV
ncbi:MAG TPA: RAD55 family ATPase [Nitrososphaeraceae archaeon]|jgi:KaiC/GvpD/RAD55 family RecA-like ATPase